MKIASIYTGAVLVPILSAMLKEQLPGCTVMNLLDDTLITDCIAANGLTKAIQLRLINLYQYAYNSGAECIINTCSSVGETVYLGRELLPIPIYRIDDAMTKIAVESHMRIGVVATLSTTLEPTSRLVWRWADELGKKVTVVKGLAEGAYDAICDGDAALHDAKIEQTAKALSSQCDVILLAQASMMRMEQKLRNVVGIPVYASPLPTIAFLKEKLREKTGK